MAPTVPKHREINWATVGCIGYVLTFSIPLPWDFSLMWLGASGLLMAMSNNVRRMHWRDPLLLETLLFIGAIASATAISSNVTLSLAFSASFLPAILLFYILAFGVAEADHVRQILTAVCTVVLSLSCVVLWTAFNMQNATPTDWIEAVAVPILVVPNDLIFLAIAAPFSFALCIGRSHRWVKVLATTSLMASLLAIVVFQSRSALLTYIVSISAIVIFYRPRWVFVGITIVSVMTVVIDGLLGFPLLSKFTQLSDRTTLWLAAISMFLENPFFGYGPHTFGVYYEAHLERIELPPWMTSNMNFTPWPHNLYLESAAEMGAIGLGFMMLLIFRCFQVLQGILKSSNTDIQMLALACISALVAFCIAGIVELTFLRIWVVVTFFILVGLTACLGCVSDVPNRGSSDS